MNKSTKIWLWVALVLCAAATIMNAFYGRMLSVVIAVAALAGLCVLLFAQRKAGYLLMCACYVLSFLVGMSLGLTLEDCLDQPKLRAAIAEPFRAEMDFIRSLPTAIRTPELLFVHGGVPSAQGIEDMEAWRCMKNDNFLGQDNRLDRWCVVGHWPTTLYRPDIPCFNPIVDREKRIISIDGGTSIKEDGQLNLVELDRSGMVSWVGLDRLPTAQALDSQEASVGSVNIRWGRDNLITVLERGEEFCRCRHLTTGREIDILTDYIWEKDGLTRCEDSTDYRLPVTAGERVSVVRRTSRGALVKKNGVTGWYTGRLTEPTPGLST